jgi:hypothetical protein
MPAKPGMEGYKMGQTPEIHSRGEIRTPTQTPIEQYNT